jgi:glutamyl-tRNA reductase
MTDAISKLGCVSIKLGQANLELLEALTIPESERVRTLQSLKESLQLQELLYIATCNRVEFLAVMKGHLSDVASLRNRILDFFFKGDDDSTIIEFEPDNFRLFSGREAIRHVFEVAASLDSIVIGESQVLGQLKAAQQFCQSIGISGLFIDRFFSASYKSAKKVRTETDLGKKSVSMASLVGLKLDEILTHNPEAVVAIIGSGPMTPKMADIVGRGRENKIYFVNRTISKIQEVANRFGGQSLTLDDFLTGKYRADIIISSTSSPSPIFDDMSLQRISDRKIIAFDLAVPRDFAESLHDSERLEIWNLERLNSLAQNNRRERFRTIDQAGRIIDEQIKLYLQKEIAQMINPLFDSALGESSAVANEGLSNLFNSKLAHLSESDRELLRYWSKKALSHACYLPARQIARHIADSDPNSGINRLLKGA